MIRAQKIWRMGRDFSHPSRCMKVLLHIADGFHGEVMDMYFYAFLLSFTLAWRCGFCKQSLDSNNDFALQHKDLHVPVRPLFDPLTPLFIEFARFAIIV